MKMVCISDSHNLADRVKIPEGDVLVHAGDFTQGGTKVEFERFAKWLAGLTHKHVVVIAGNHDWLAEDNPRLAREVVTGARESAHYLHDESITIDGIKFYGSPYQPAESDYFLMLRNSFGLAEMNERVARGIEEIFSDDDRSQIVNLYRRNPLLMRLLGSQRALFELGEQAAQDMVRRAAERVPYVVTAGVC